MHINGIRKFSCIYQIVNEVDFFQLKKSYNRNAHMVSDMTLNRSNTREGGRRALIYRRQPACLPALPHCAAAVCCAAGQSTAAGRRLLPHSSGAALTGRGQPQQASDVAGTRIVHVNIIFPIG